MSKGPNITVTKMAPLVINSPKSRTEFGKVTLEDGGYIEIQIDCSMYFDEIVMKGGNDKTPSIILNGMDGDPGKIGQDGEPGKPGAVADITIGELSSDILIHVFGGGNGGHGGLGADGGKGGNGADGAYGGDGGDGGDGGQGGSGGSGGKLVLKYASSKGCKVKGEAKCAAGGDGGFPGVGGDGGQGLVNGRKGRDGRKGLQGEFGEPGTLTIEGE